MTISDLKEEIDFDVVSDGGWLPERAKRT